MVSTALDVIIGAVTFSGRSSQRGSCKAGSRATGGVPGARFLNATLAAVAIAGGGYLVSGSTNAGVLLVVSSPRWRSACSPCSRSAARTCRS